MSYGTQVPSFMQGAMQGYGFMDDIYSRRNQEERQAKQDEQRDELFQMKKEQYGTQKDSAAIKGAAANMQSGFDPTDEQLAVLQRYGLDNPEGREKAERDLQVVESIMQSGDLSKFRSKEGITALNSLLGPDINSDRKGNPLPGRREITDIMPGQEPGTAVFELSGEYEDGAPFKGAPMTEGRGTEKDGDNVVLQQFVGDITKKLQGQRAIIEGYKNDPAFRAKVDAWFKAKGASSSTGGGELVEVKQGDKIVTMMKKSDGSLVPFAEADRWNPKSGGALKPKDIENMAYQRVAKGMGLDSQNYMDFTPQTHEELSRLSAEVAREYKKNPSQGINAAHARVMSRLADEKDSATPETPTEAELKRAAAELNSEKGNSSDWVPFNEYGVADDEVLARAYQNREKGVAANQGGTGQPRQQGSAAQGQGPVRVSSPQEAEALPSGTQFITPDGEVRVKR